MENLGDRSNFGVGPKLTHSIYNGIADICLILSFRSVFLQAKGASMYGGEGGELRTTCRKTLIRKGLYLEALELANSSPCDPKTLTRAARDMAETEPSFAIEAGMTALKWLVEGYGYDVTSEDVRAAFSYTMKAAEAAGRKPETFERIRTLVAGEVFGERFVTRILGQTLGLHR